MKFSLLLLFAISSATFARGPAGTFRQAYGPLFHPQPPDFAANAKKFAREPVHHWNQIAIDATGLDHTPVAPGENRTFGEQLGPGRASRAMAIVHIAIFDAINAANGKYQSYTGIQSAPHPFSAAAAVAQAAHDTLVALFPSQKPSFDQALVDDLLRITGEPLKTNGVAFGKQVATAVLASRVSDGADVPEPQIGVNYFTSNFPGHWRQDPISLIPIALGAHWGHCKPFVIKSSRQFLAPPPPALISAAYTTAYNEAKNFGGDGIHTLTQRTPEQTFIGTFWAYDGTPSLCAPPRLYNQIAVHIADLRAEQQLDVYVHYSSSSEPPPGIRSMICLAIQISQSRAPVSFALTSSFTSLPTVSTRDHGILTGSLRFGPHIRASRLDRRPSAG